MQFIVIAKDAEDENALGRRQVARDAHIAYSDIAAKIGGQIIGAAMLDGDNEMRGSVMIVDFASIEKLHEWLDHEPYITENVWKDIDIIPCKVEPSFNHMVIKKP